LAERRAAFSGSVIVLTSAAFFGGCRQSKETWPPTSVCL
jgi:hypothetical protein